MQLIQHQLQKVLENRTGGSSTGTSQVHPHYAEDLDSQPLYEGRSARQCRRH